MIFIPILLFATVLLIVYIFFQIKFRYWYWRTIAYIKPTIPFGNYLTSCHATSNLMKIYTDLKCMYGSELQFGGIFILWYPLAVSINTNFIKAVLKKDFEYFHDRGLYSNEKDDPLSVNLLTSGGKQWRHMRAQLMPSFSSAKLKGMFVIMRTVANNMCNHLNVELSTLNGGDSINLKDVVERYNIDVIGSCAFGIECNSFTDRDSLFIINTKRTFEKPKIGVIKAALIMASQRLARMLNIKTTHDQVTDFFLKIFRDTVKYREENQIRRNDLLDSLIELKRNDDTVTLNHIAAQSFLFFLGGYSSSSSLLSFCLYELAINPAMQHKLREEIIRVSELYNDAEICYDAISDMTYMHQVLNETLRKYPPVFAVLRQTTTNYSNEILNVKLAKGTYVMVPTYAIHRDPEHFPDPDKFKPERFAKNSHCPYNPDAYLPFGGGPRMCIASRFGLLQARIGLAMLIKHFKFEKGKELIEPIELFQNKAFLGLKNPLWIRVTKINGKK